MNPIYAYCDGSCDNSRKEKGAGYGIVLIHDNRRKEIRNHIQYKNYEGKLTSTLAEILAVVYVIHEIKVKAYDVILHSDSEFVIKSLNGIYTKLRPDLKEWISNIHVLSNSKRLNMKYVHLSDTNSSEIKLCHQLANDGRKGNFSNKYIL